MSELRSFEREAAVALLVGLVAAGLLAVLVNRADMLTGIAAGGLVGLANLAWLVGTVRHLRVGVGVRALQAAGAVRYAAMGLLLGVVLVVGHVDPVGAVVGYALFPFAAAAAGWHRLGPASARS